MGYLFSPPYDCDGCVYLMSCVDFDYNENPCNVEYECSHEDNGCGYCRKNCPWREEDSDAL